MQHLCNIFAALLHNTSQFGLLLRREGAGTYGVLARHLDRKDMLFRHTFCSSPEPGDNWRINDPAVQLNGTV